MQRGLPPTRVLLHPEPLPADVLPVPWACLPRPAVPAKEDTHTRAGPSALRSFRKHPGELPTAEQQERPFPPPRPPAAPGGAEVTRTPAPPQGCRPRPRPGLLCRKHTVLCNRAPCQAGELWAPGSEHRRSGRYFPGAVTATPPPAVFQSPATAPVVTRLDRSND